MAAPKAAPQAKPYQAVATDSVAQIAERLAAVLGLPRTKTIKLNRVFGSLFLQVHPCSLRHNR